MLDNRVGCNVCGESFYSRKRLEQHARNTHTTVNKIDVIKAVKKPLKISNKLIVVIAACVLIAIIGNIATYMLIWTSSLTVHIF